MWKVVKVIIKISLCNEISVTKKNGILGAKRSMCWTLLNASSLGFLNVRRYHKNGFAH